MTVAIGADSRSRLFPLLSRAIHTSRHVNLISGFVNELTELTSALVPSGKFDIHAFWLVSLGPLVGSRPHSLFFDSTTAVTIIHCTTPH